MKMPYTLYSTCCYVPSYYLQKMPAKMERTISAGVRNLDGTPLAAAAKIICPKCQKVFQPAIANVRAT